MKAAAFLLLLFFVHLCNGQSLEKDFELGGAKIFKVNVAQGKIIRLKTTLVLPAPGAGTRAADSMLLTSLDRAAFLFQVKNQMGVVGDSDFVNSHLAEAEHTLTDIYNAFYPDDTADKQKMKADSLAKVAAEDSLVYGRDEYYGLTNIQKDSLIVYLKALRSVQEDRYSLRKDAKFDTILHSLHKNIKPDSISSIRHEQSRVYRSDSIKLLYNTETREINRLERGIRALKEFRQFQVSLIGNANVVSSFKIAQQTQLNGGFGIIVSKPNHIEFLGAFTISQSSDTISSIGKTSADFGTALLVPGVRRFSLLTSFRQRQLFPTSYSNFWRKIGIAWNVNITPYSWAIRKTDNSTDSAGLTAKPIPVAMDLMFPFSWVNVYKEDQEVCISTDLGFTCRYLLGDINTEQRKQFLGQSNKFYGGFIGGINIRYNGLRFQFHVPLLFGSHVDGLTGGQAYASMSFVARIVGPNSIKSLFK